MTKSLVLSSMLGFFFFSLAGCTMRHAREGSEPVISQGNPEATPPSETAPEADSSQGEEEAVSADEGLPVSRPSGDGDEDDMDGALQVDP